MVETLLTRLPIYTANFKTDPSERCRTGIDLAIKFSGHIENALFPSLLMPCQKLQKLESLEYASLFGTNLTAEQSSQLVSAPSKTRWDIRRGAFLGDSCAKDFRVGRGVDGAAQ